MIDGMIAIRKEKDYTSHDVVARMRGILKQKKIGHTGTLDPMAEGVLPVALGAATKLCELFSDRSKTYEAVVRLGVATDTEDITGQVTGQDDTWTSLSEATIAEAVESFRGIYDQVPPMYSALKVNGRKLYEYARKGEVIEREARRLTIYDIRLLWVKLPLLGIEVSCSKGTYIRTLSKDLGERLGTCACMEALTRTRVGEYTLDKCMTLAELETIVSEGRIAEYMSTVDSVFRFMDAYRVLPEGESKLRNGNPVDTLHTVFMENGVGEAAVVGEWDDCVRIYDPQGHFIGVYRRVKEAEVFHPQKLFFVNNGGGTT